VPHKRLGLLMICNSPAEYSRGRKSAHARRRNAARYERDTRTQTKRDKEREREREREGAKGDGNVGRALVAARNNAAANARLPRERGALRYRINYLLLILPGFPVYLMRRWNGFKSGSHRSSLTRPLPVNPRSYFRHVVLMPLIKIPK